MTKKTIWVTGFISLSVMFGTVAVMFGFQGTGAPAGSVSADATKREEKPYVVIDPGHGGEDGGCSSSDGIVEKDLNLEVSKSIAEMLNSAGYKTVLTRTEDKLLYDMYGDLSDYKGHKKVFDLKNRLRFSKESGAALVVSIHMNKFTDPKYSGLQVYYSKRDGRSVGLADKIQSLTAEYLQPENDRKTKPAGTDIYLLDRIDIPAVMVECGFLSNEAETRLLSDSGYQQKLSLCISSAVIDFLADNCTDK